MTDHCHCHQHHTCMLMYSRDHPPPTTSMGLTASGGGLHASDDVTFTETSGVNIHACSAGGKIQMPHHLAIAVLALTSRHHCHLHCPTHVH